MATLKKDIIGIWRKVYGKAGDKVTVLVDYGNTLAVEDSTGDKWFVSASLVSRDDIEIMRETQSFEQVPVKMPARIQKPVKINPSQGSLF